jgi:hypothetical protein
MHFKEPGVKKSFPIGNNVVQCDSIPDRQESFSFSAASRLAPWPTQPMDTGRPVLSSKATGAEANHTPLSGDMIKNLFSHTSAFHTPPWHGS